MSTIQQLKTQSLLAKFLFWSGVIMGTVSSVLLLLFVGGNVIDDGGANITAYGIVWSSNENNLSIENNEGITNDGSGNGNYSSLLDGLIPCRTYYLKAYAINSVGTAYGEIISFGISI